MKYYFNLINETISIQENNGEVSNFSYRYIDSMIQQLSEKNFKQGEMVLRYLKEIYDINQKVFITDDIFKLNTKTKDDLETRLKSGEIIAIKEFIVNSNYLNRLNEINEYFPLVISNYINDILNLKNNYKKLFDLNTMTFIKDAQSIDILEVVNDSEKYAYMNISINENNILNSTISLNQSEN